jgi:hypothetical protein
MAMDTAFLQEWQPRASDSHIVSTLQNINNTPDVGFQLGWSYVLARRSR